MFPLFPHWISPVHFAISCVRTAVANQWSRVQEAALPVLEPVVLNTVFAFHRAKIRAHLRVQALRRRSVVARWLIGSAELMARNTWYAWALLTRKYIEPSEDVCINVFVQNVVFAADGPRYSSTAHTYSAKYGWPALQNFYEDEAIEKNVVDRRRSLHRDKHCFQTLLWKEFVAKYTAVWLQLRSQMQLQQELLAEQQRQKTRWLVYFTMENSTHKHRHATPEEHCAENTEVDDDDDDDDDDDGSSCSSEDTSPLMPNTLDMCQQSILLVGYFANNVRIFREITLTAGKYLAAEPLTLNEQTGPPGQSEVDFLAVEYIASPGATPIPLEIPRSHYAVGNEILSRSYIYWYLEHLPRYTAWTFSEDYEVKCMDDTLCEVVLRRNQYIQLGTNSYSVVHVSSHDNDVPDLVPIEGANKNDKETQEQNERLSLLPVVDDDEQWEKIGDSP